MASYDVTIDTSAVQAALAKLAPDQIDKRAHAAMNESLGYLQTAVRDRTPTGATAQLWQSIFTDIRGTTFAGMQGRVASPLSYAVFAEEGRAPGKFPPRAPIELWAQRVLGDASLWFIVARAIARRGTKGAHMFRDAAQKGQGVVRRIFLSHFKL